MVVFTCNACCAVLKRSQVDQHCYRCRGCESLSCVDCGKDFWGDEYQKHLKCITEEEKYAGKGPKMFKGEAKQEQWVEQVQNAIEKASSKPKLKRLLESISEYPNIPRKKAKFENFVKNSLGVHYPALISELWDVLMAGTNRTPNVNKEEPSNQESQTEAQSNGHGTDLKTSNSQQEDETTESKQPTKSKREKKEERRQKAHKKEKKDKLLETDETNTAAEVPKKSKKRKRHESEERCEQDDESADEKAKENIKKKKKKKKETTGEMITEDAIPVNENRLENPEDEEEAPPAKRKKIKFDWDAVIKAVLEKKGEMSLKKLKKKVLSEFAAQDAANYNEDNLLSAKFDKKILKTPGVKVSKDRASLKTK